MGENIAHDNFMKNQARKASRTNFEIISVSLIFLVVFSFLLFFIIKTQMRTDREYPHYPADKIEGFERRVAGATSVSKAGVVFYKNKDPYRSAEDIWIENTNDFNVYVDITRDGYTKTSTFHWDYVTDTYGYIFKPNQVKCMSMRGIRPPVKFKISDPSKKYLDSVSIQ
jgi:hypothetical protein